MKCKFCQHPIKLTADGKSLKIEMYKCHSCKCIFWFNNKLKLSVVRLIIIDTNVYDDWNNDIDLYKRIQCDYDRNTMDILFQSGHTNYYKKFNFIPEDISPKNAENWFDKLIKLKAFY